jgi:RimJ/RimL family protein N-acetyltransferase
MAHHLQPELNIDELILRPWRPEDVTVLVQAYRDPAIQQWHCRSMTNAEAKFYIEAANRAWADESAANWAVTDGDDVLGRMSVKVDLTEGLAAIGYWTLPAARGHGVAPRALGVASNWATSRLGLHRLELEHSTLNEPSCRVALKAGYALESTKRSQARHADGWHDMHLHVRFDMTSP